MSLTNQEAREEVRNLIAVGKERGYLLSDEIDSILPAGEHTPEEIDDHLSAFEHIGINIYEDLAAAKAAQTIPDAVDSEPIAVAEESELDLTPGMLDKNNVGSPGTELEFAL